jgi:hypothetical protein
LVTILVRHMIMLDANKLAGNLYNSGAAVTNRANIMKEVLCLRGRVIHECGKNIIASPSQSADNYMITILILNLICGAYTTLIPIVPVYYKM